VQYLKLLNRSRAVYSQFTYDFNPIVSVTGGIRYSDDMKGFYTKKCAVRVAAPTTCVGADQANGTFLTPAKTWTPMGSLQLNAPEAWTHNGVLDQAMAYFTYSKGFKNGGFNANGTTTAGNLTAFNPERVENYEVGLKFSMFDRRLVGSVSRYDMSYSDIQLNVQSNNPVTGAPIASIFNAGAAKIQGIEVELQALLMESLRLSFNGDFTQPRYTKFDDLSAPGGTRVGEPLPLIPRYRVSGSIENRFSLGGEMALTPRVQVTRTGDRYMFTSLSAANRAAGHADAITIVDASLRYELNEMFSLDFYGKNIFNKRTINDSLAFGDHVINWYSAPTTYGVTARMKF
jgi:iron complex outermembrane receptor protein